MTGVEALAWLVLAFGEGPDCLLQVSFQPLPNGLALVREDGCAVHSLQEGSHVVLWSDTRWVAIKIPAGIRSLSYRWGRAVAFVDGKSVTVQYGSIMGDLLTRPSLRHQKPSDPIEKWRTNNSLIRRGRDFPDESRDVHRLIMRVPWQSTPVLLLESAADALFL